MPPKDFIMNDIPPSLIENIAKKNIVLFLGSGFLHNALHKENRKAPLGNELADLLSDKFLSGKYNGLPLAFVADLAISESSLFAVQLYIYEIFEAFEPNESHILFSSFPWKAIFTTNYDLIIEKSYRKNSNTVQNLSVVYKNTPEQQIFRNINSVPYYKLHGCITYINDENLPLILSTEQYIDHKLNRDRLFSKLHELTLDYSILFLGYNNQDINIRTILQELGKLKDARPRSYIVKPHIDQAEARYWEGRKIAPIKLGYEQFIQQVSDSIPENSRRLSVFRPEVDKPIFKKFQLDIQESKPTESLISFIEQEAEYVHSAIASQDTTPKAFYMGYFENWDPIIKNLDVDRMESDRILTQLILEDKYQKEKKSFFFLIKGYAGSGKSVLLKRVAWEAAIEFDKFCVFIKRNISLRYEPLIELYNYVKDRIYVFIDNAIENEKGIITLIEKAERNEIPISIIATERTNLWNEESELKNFTDEEFRVSYLSSEEIDNLISKLEKHNALGYLETKTADERRYELQEKAGRVLLVALHEATAGKPFEEIILDEYMQLRTEQAKSLYLTVSILHRLGSEARAGLINRVHGINFQEFKEKLFEPLEFIVFSEKNYIIGDFVYKTRHPHIAEIVFETVLKNEQDRYDEYLRILSFIDPDFKSDYHAFLAMTNARQLLLIFKEPRNIRNLFDAAEEHNPNSPKLLQQRAIFEMLSKDGNLSTAEKFLRNAYNLAPNDPLISHSFAELYLKRAEISINSIEKSKFLSSATDLCYNIIKKHKNRVYPYHTLLKVGLMKLSDVLEKNDSISIESRIKEIEKLLSITKQKFTDENFLLEIEARFNRLIDNEPKAIELLKKAHNSNKATPFIALRYAKTLENNGQLPEALDVLKETLNLNPNDRDVNFKYAHLLSKIDPSNDKDILHYYRRSFTKGDTRYEAQFWYARALYIFNKIDDARPIFEHLSYARVSPEKKNTPRGRVKSDGKLVLYKGTIARKEANFAFVTRDIIGDDIFIYRYSEEKDWHTFTVEAKVSFNLAFNFKGSIALNSKVLE